MLYIHVHVYHAHHGDVGVTTENVATFSTLIPSHTPAQSAYTPGHTAPCGNKHDYYLEKRIDNNQKLEVCVHVCAFVCVCVCE